MKRLVLGGAACILLVLIISGIPRLASALDSSLNNLEIYHVLAAQRPARLFPALCFLGFPQSSSIPQVVNRDHAPSGGRAVLWQLTAAPTAIDVAKVQHARGSADRVFENLLAGCTAFQRGQIEDARVYFGRLPGMEVLLRKWGEQQESAGSLALAEQSLSLAADLDMTRADTHYAYVSFLRRHGGSPTTILTELKTTVRLAPDNWIYRVALGEILTEQGGYEDAVKAFSEAIDLAPSVGALYVNRGAVHFKLGRQDDACADLRRAYALDSTQRDLIAQMLCSICAQHDLCSTVQP